jgi:hypothetical protein
MGIIPQHAMDIEKKRRARPGDGERPESKVSRGFRS